MKIFIPPLPEKLHVGEYRQILLDGVASHPGTRSVNTESEADFILLDFRHLQAQRYQIRYPQKTVIVDYQDCSSHYYRHDALLYFKRSVVDNKIGRLVTFNRNIIPIAYALRSDYAHLAEKSVSRRDIDIAVFFDTTLYGETQGTKHRAYVARYVESNYAHKSIFVGLIGANGERGRSRFQPAYAAMLLRAKIVVTCNPDRWQGDFRLFEAMASGAAVVCDKMLTPILNPFIDGEHLLYYDRQYLSSLGRVLDRLLGDECFRRSLAEQGYAHTHAYHQPVNRIDQIITEARRATALNKTP